MSLFRLKGTSGAVINQAWKLEQRAVIGTADDCEIRVEGESVAPHHAELLVSDRAITVKALPGGGEVEVNGVATSETALASGDEIRVGENRWMVQAPGLRPERVLTEQAVRKRTNIWPWLIAGLLSAAALVAWKLGYLAPPQ